MQLVTVNPQPIGSVTGATTICAGASTTLTASGGTNYEWSNGPTTAANTVSPTTSTTYSVTITDTNGCKDTLMQLVTVNPSPMITGISVICSGSVLTSVTVAASITSGTLEYNTNGGAFQTSNVLTPPAVALGLNTFIVKEMTTMCADTLASQTVSCNCPAITNDTISTNDTICIGSPVSMIDGSTIVVTPATASTYQWQSSPSGANMFVDISGVTTEDYTPSNVTTSTDYRRVIKIDNCPDEFSNVVKVTVNPQPIGSITGTTTICIGTSTTLTASGGTSYEWSNGLTTAANAVSPATSTTYSVTITDTNGCKDTLMQLVTVNPQPIGSITGTTTICKGTSTTLTASGGTSYEWSNGPTTAANAVSPATSTTYNVTITDANGCKDTLMQLVTVNPQPIGSITGTTTICAGASTTLTATGGNSYEWSNGPYDSSQYSIASNKYNL